MSAALLILSLLSLWGAGRLAVCALDGGFRTGAGSGSLSLSLSLGLGCGITSAVFFLSLILGGRIPLLPTDIAVTTVTAAGFYLFSRFSAASRPLPVSAERTRSDRWIMALAVIIIASAPLQFMLRSISSQAGDVDAFVIWNMRARTLFSDGMLSMSAFGPRFNHVDYPLLLPLSIARLWSYYGNATPLVPIGVALFFTGSTLLLLYGAIGYLRDKGHAALALCMLLAVPFFIYQGASQYADTALGFYFLLTIVLLAIAERNTSIRYRCLFFAGMAASFSAWTKNEGLMFLVLLVLSRLPVFSGRDAMRKALRETLVIVCGGLPVLAVLFYFKIFVGTSNDVVTLAHVASSGMLVLNHERHISVLKALASRVYAGWFIAGAGLLFYALFARISFGNERTLIYFMIRLLCLIFLGYYTIYLITPHEIPWHVASSVNRLIVQLWPMIIFLYFLMIAPYGYAEADPEQGRPVCTMNEGKDV
ncbi:MAG: hypothetical protein IT393_00755 [Nitrospirae bacterium]|nr:hypothetical protein [Nitrospirota bacterium]